MELLKRKHYTTFRYTSKEKINRFSFKRKIVIAYKEKEIIINILSLLHCVSHEV